MFFNNLVQVLRVKVVSKVTSVCRRLQFRLAGMNLPLFEKLGIWPEDLLYVLGGLSVEHHL